MDPKKSISIILKIAAVTSRDKFCLWAFEEGDIRYFIEKEMEMMLSKSILTKTN